MSQELIGYASKLSIEPGEQLAFMVHTTASTYRPSIVRLIHGDPNPLGPGLKTELVDDLGCADLTGKPQSTLTGSFAWVPTLSVDYGKGHTVALWIQPALPQNHTPQGLVSHLDDSGDGWEMYLDKVGVLHLALSICGHVTRLAAPRPLLRQVWYFIAATVQPNGISSLLTRPLAGLTTDSEQQAVGSLGSLAYSHAAFLLAARRLASVSPARAIHCFNGKIESPLLFNRVLATEELSRLAAGEMQAIDTCVGAWDLSMMSPADQILDRSPLARHAQLVNAPTRAVPSHHWRGTHLDFRNAHTQYAAIHFHEDDLEDAAWTESFRWTPPAELRSGMYAARLEANGLVDHIPFVVRPGPSVSSAPILFLASTLTYLAYANYLVQSLTMYKQQSQPFPIDPKDQLLMQHPEWGLSCYDTHLDGSGVTISSSLRPIPNFRPDYHFWLTGAPERLGADLYIIDWLEHTGHSFDVVTDHDLHAQGLELLKNYRVLITGTHPEYCTALMLDALEDYLMHAGKVMYLGGNGFYWVTTIDPAKPYLIEIRRGHAGTRTWNSAPGEEHHAQTGELGGLWRYRGRAPNRCVGIGFAAQGSDIPSPGYERRPDSFRSEAAFVFKDVAPNEIIGDFGLVMEGAAGYEIDRFDESLGSPTQTLLLATSQGRHSDMYQLVVEDILSTRPGLGGTDNPEVRADMVLLDWSSGGRVFSVGSINWAGSLSWNNYENNVSQITENVLREFLNGS